MNKLLLISIFVLVGCWLIPQDEEDYLGDWKYIKSSQTDSVDYYISEGLLELHAGGDFSSNFSYFVSEVDSLSEEDISGSWVVTIDRYKCTGASISSEMIELSWGDTSKYYYVEFYTDSTFLRQTGGTQSSWWLWIEGPVTDCFDDKKHHYWQKID
ncbi:MAG: hypothetical protein K9N35_08565 [Candidatus Marinimicrobia bacterium]|nr:hypothetical protein [Candidatus Neomarinimicrobiota bacterium]